MSDKPSNLGGKRLSGERATRREFFLRLGSRGRDEVTVVKAGIRGFVESVRPPDELVVRLLHDATEPLVRLRTDQVVAGGPIADLVPGELVVARGEWRDEVFCAGQLLSESSLLEGRIMHRVADCIWSRLSVRAFLHRILGLRERMLVHTRIVHRGVRDLLRLLERKPRARLRVSRVHPAGSAGVIRTPG